MITRLISGFIMALIAVFAIFKLPALGFNAILGLLMIGGLSEWKKLCSASIAMFIACVVGVALFFVAVSAAYVNPATIAILLGLGVATWLYKTLTLASNKPPKFCLIQGAALLALAWLAMVQLREVNGSLSLMLAILIVWCADSFAYFGGKRFGKTKLAPSISPGKTREGVASGVLAAVLVALVYTHYLIAPISSISHFLTIMIVAILVALISVVGDLSESKLKRAAGMKDSGSLIPGHGGILDRIDGLIAGVVVYAFYATIV